MATGRSNAPLISTGVQTVKAEPVSLQTITPWQNLPRAREGDGEVRAHPPRDPPLGFSWPAPCDSSRHCPFLLVLFLIVP